MDARNTIGFPGGEVQHGDLVREPVVGGLAGAAGGLALTPGVVGGAGHVQDPAQQNDRIVRLLRVDEPAQLAHRSFSFTKKAVAFFRISIVCCCSRFSLRSRLSSSRSALVNSPDSPSPGAVLALRYQPRSDSELMPSSRATAVTVLPEESTSAIASRLNSSVYRFVYLFPTWCYFLWNLRSQSPGVQDQGEASNPSHESAATELIMHATHRETMPSI